MKATVYFYEHGRAQAITYDNIVGMVTDKARIFVDTYGNVFNPDDMLTRFYLAGGETATFYAEGIEIQFQ